MKKKENPSSNGQGQHSHNLLFKLVSQNFERKNIDSAMMITMNNFVFNLGEAITKNSNAIVPDTLKLAIELIIAFQSNLSEDTSRHTCNLEEIVNFFANLLLFVDKVSLTWNDFDKLVHSEMINVFWFLLQRRVQEVRLPPNDKKMELLNSLIQSSQSYKPQRFNLDFLIKESFSFTCMLPDSKAQISNIFISYLRSFNTTNTFKAFMQKYINQCLTSNHSSNFKKALTIYQHFGTTFEERRLSIEELTIKILESNYNLNFVVEINQIYSFSKLFTSQTSLKAIVKTIQKVIEKPTANASITKILEQISQLCLSDIDDSSFEKVDLRLDTFLNRIIDWVISRSFKKEKQDEIKQNALHEAEQREEKLIQFVKKLSSKIVSEDIEPQNNQELQKICNAFSKILKKLITNNKFKAKLANITLDSFPFLRNERITNEAVKNFILDVVPSLLIQFNLSFKQKSPLVYAVVLKRAEMEAQKKPDANTVSLQDYFNQAYFQLLHSDSLNYHFILCFIFMKYLHDKEAVIEIILEELIKDLAKQGRNKSNRNLILNMALLLKALHPVSSSLPVKFRIRQAVKSAEILSQKLDINQIMVVCSKELGMLRDNNISITSHFIDFQLKLNEQLDNYTKDFVTIYYSLIIGISDIIEHSDPRLVDKNNLLLQIKFIRKINFLSETFTLIRCFIEKETEWTQNGVIQEKTISIFLLLSKLFSQIKNKPTFQSMEDLDLFLEKLKDYMFAINSSISFNQLVTLDNFKNNKNQYKEDKFLEYLTSKNFIRFYSESIQDLNATHIILMRIALKLFRKATQAKGQPFEQVQDEVKTLFLVYLHEESPPEFRFTDKHELHFKYYLLLLILSGRIDQKAELTPILDKLKLNPTVIKELTLGKHEVNYINHFKAKNPLNFVEICLKSIISILSSNEKQDVQLFRFFVFLIEDDKKDNCCCFAEIIKEKIAVELEHRVIELIVKRVQVGLQLEEKKRVEFLEDSCSLYHLLGKALEKNQLLTLVQEIVQIDYYSDCDKSAFLLKEIANIFSVVEEKSSPVCETIFNYILTLAEIFPGQQKLQIANFICSFFGLSSGNQEGNLESLEKPLALQCTNQCNYKCLQCDDKRLVCLACSLTCHKGHPVCFLSIPPEIKISRCQCKQISNCCQYSKDNGNQNRPNPRAKAEFPPPVNNYAPAYLGGASRQFIERIKYGVPRPKPDDPFNQNRFEYNQFIQEEEFDRMEHDLMGNPRYYQPLVKDQFVPRIGSRLDRLFDRDDLPQAYRIQIDQSRPPPQNNPFLREKEREKDPSKEEAGETVEPQFVDELYEKDSFKMEIQDGDKVQGNETILKKYALLPKFIDLMINFCSKKATKDKNVTNLELWSPIFNNPLVQRMVHVSLKVCNPGSFHVEVRRENPLNNVSCVLIKRNLASNNRFVIIATGTDLQIYSKEKLLIIASQGKPQGFSPIHRHSVSYEVHSVEISPVDKSLLCVAGLHNISLFTINSEGGIGRTQSRYNVNNLYINKIKLTKMGIFVGVEKEIRVLNYSCKHVLTIKAQQSNTLIRQWSIYQKAAGCQVFFVCPNGNIFFTDILPADEGKKQFTGRINDHRKTKNSTGASVFVKDLPDMGKLLFASFKDGYNILGRLQGDQMENMTDIRFKGLKTQKNLFDTFYIVGHVDIVKLHQIDDVYVICTVKKYFPPEMAFHQGLLAMVRLKKDGNTDIQILNEEATCQTFQVFYVGNKHFFIVSLHTDGSLHLNSPTKIPKMVIDEQIRKARQNEQGVVGNLNESQPDLIQKIRKSMEKQLTFERIKTLNYSSSYLFRQNTDSLKPLTDYIINKLNEHQYEVKQITFTKIITGISLPHYGTVQLPTRNIENVFEVGFTHSESLYFFANGTFRFKYFKNQSEKFTRESINLANNRILQKIERIERLNEYSEHERLINSSMMSNFLNIKEDANPDIIFVARPFETFKNKIPKFDQFFSIETDEESSSIEKTALIIKMFLSKGLKEGNICEKQEIIELVNSLKSIVADVNRKLFKLLKEIIIIAVKVYQKLIGRTMSLYTQQNYGLRAATESRLLHFYSLLKLDIGDEELNELLELLTEIIEQDLSLFAFYCAKYSGMITQLYRRIKRADTDIRAEALLKIYAIAYPVLNYCEIPCGWILSAVPQTIYSFVTSKGVRQSFYDALSQSKLLSLEPALKGLGNSQNDAEDLELLKNVQQGLAEQENAKDPCAQIYMMFSRGEIDEDTMLRMIQDATKLEYEKAQEINQKPPEEDSNMQDQLELQMEENGQEVDNNNVLLFDLIDECTESFEGDLEVILGKIVTLYVVSKAVDAHYKDLTEHLVLRIFKLVSEIDIKWEGDKLAAVLSYSSLFNRIFITSTTMKDNGYKRYLPYLNVKAELNLKLGQLEFDKIPKIKNPINLLPKIFRGQKPTPQIHIAYALANLYLYPCEPSHIILSLQCYWLLPNPKETYAKQKCESSIKDGINSGNLAKVYEIVKQNPEIWQSTCEYLDFIEKWIQEKRNNWELALQLLAIYYQQ